MVAELRAKGIKCSPNYDDVREGEKIVEQAMKEYGRVDIIINVRAIKDGKNGRLTYSRLGKLRFGTCAP